MWKQPVIVDNRAGGVGIIGAELVIKAPADGYSLLVDASNLAQNPALRKSMPFDLTKDLTPVSLLVKVPNILLVNPQFQAKTVPDLIALAKAKPGTINYASGGNGSSPHLAGELFDLQAGTRMVHIPYKGGAPAMVDVMGGQVPVIFAALASALPNIRAGKFYPVAVAANRRSPVLPNTPTFAESGLPSYEMYEWNAVLAPAGTPTAVIQKISNDIAAALADREIHARLIAMGAEVVGSSPQELSRFLGVELAKWRKLAGQAKLSTD
jgi:tripartite-type tricarboxylate transporter receptor subunit TctC